LLLLVLLLLQLLQLCGCDAWHPTSTKQAGEALLLLWLLLLLLWQSLLCHWLHGLSVHQPAAMHCHLPSRTRHAHVLLWLLLLDVVLLWLLLLGVLLGVLVHVSTHVPSHLLLLLLLLKWGCDTRDGYQLRSQVRAHQLQYETLDSSASPRHKPGKDAAAGPQQGSQPVRIS
jgi:hypothetical protein